MKTAGIFLTAMLFEKQKRSAQLETLISPFSLAIWYDAV